MKKYILLIILAFFCIGAGRMWDYGELDLYDIGNLTWVDEIDSNYTCDGTPDWTTGAIESFEASDGNFCTDDWAVSDSASVINTKDTTQYHHLTASASFDCANDHAGTNTVTGTLDSAQGDHYFGLWLYVPDVSGKLRHVIKLFSSTPTEMMRIILEDDSGTDYLCIDSDTDASCADEDTFTVSTPAWYYVSIFIDRNGAANSTSYVKLYDNGTPPSQQNCNGSSACSTNILYNAAATPDEDVSYIQFQEDSNHPTTNIFYVDYVENSATEVTP